MRDSAERLQHDFYTATAAAYRQEWEGDTGPHHQALSFVSAMIDGYGYESVLDVGSGTGRGPEHLLRRHPSVTVRGVEPVRAMIDQAEQVVGVPSGVIVEGRGQALPFADASFDVACEFGILHHVRDPDVIVREMTRVARRAVFLSDANRYALGGRLTQAVRYAIYRSGLGPAFTWVRTRGRGYLVLENDGVCYSYSVYDSLPVLAEWADRVFLVPTAPSPVGPFHPLFGSVHVLVCAVRDS